MLKRSRERESWKIFVVLRRNNTRSGHKVASTFLVFSFSVSLFLSNDLQNFLFSFFFVSFESCFMSFYSIIYAQMHTHVLYTYISLRIRSFMNGTKVRSIKKNPNIKANEQAIKNITYFTGSVIFHLSPLLITLSLSLIFIHSPFRY